MTIHIGTVPYCNAFPLVYHLPEVLPQAVVSEWVPSAMRKQLVEGRLDLALMPVAELSKVPQGKIVSNCCIACNGAVRSVLLVSRKPIEQIQTISLDSASRSSVKVCEVLLRRFYNLEPEKHSLETGVNPNDCFTDAFVIIGDRALAYRPNALWNYRYDIGELWKLMTGLPLIFAAWVGCTPRAWNPALASALETARDWGLQQLDTILDTKKQQGVALPLAREQILDYYRQAVVYRIGEEENAGLQCFLSLV